MGKPIPNPNPNPYPYPNPNQADLVAPWVMWEKNARYSCHAVGRNAVQQVLT